MSVLDAAFAGLLAEIRQAVRDEIATVLESARTEGARSPALLDRRQLAEALGVSLATLNRLRAEPDFPTVLVGDAPRFRLDAVLAWLEARNRPARQAGKQRRKPAKNRAAPSPVQKPVSACEDASEQFRGLNGCAR